MFSSELPVEHYVNVGFLQIIGASNVHFNSCFFVFCFKYQSLVRGNDSHKRNTQSLSFDLPLHLSFFIKPLCLFHSPLPTNSHISLRRAFHNITNLKRQIPVHSLVLKTIWYQKYIQSSLRTYFFRIVIIFIFTPPMPGRVSWDI